MKAAGPFTRELWEAALPVYRELLSCGFTAGLADGTLPEESFAHFIAQDILYLRKDAEAFGIIAERSEAEKERSFFLRLQTDGIEVERVLHREFAGFYNIEEVTEQSPAFADYSNFLLDHARKSPFTVAICALLPCYWLYAEKGRHILKNSTPGNPYKKFIDTYSGDEFESYVKEFLGIVELNGQRYPARREAVKAFVEASEFEVLVLRESMKR